MRGLRRDRIAAGALWLGIAGFSGCATPAVVFVSPDYKAQHISRVAVQGFADFSGRPGSGAMIADVFEKYLFNLHYEIVDSNQAKVDAVITGSISELTEMSEQTVMVDVPQEETEPVYQQVVVPGRHGLRTVTQQTGTQTIYSTLSVPETETLPARVGLSARLVSSKNGALLWSGSGSADGMNISAAAEEAASKIIDALSKELDKPQKAAVPSR